MEIEHPKPRAVPAREATSLLEEQQDSGLSIAAFAKSKNVAAWSLYNARTRARKEQEAPFSEVAIVNERRAAPTDPIELVLPSGLTLRVRSDFDDVALRRLLGLLATC